MHGPPVVTDIAGPASGPLCMVYRTVRATRRDVGAAELPAEPLLDRAGRPLVLTYGFICSGSSVVAPRDQDLRVARSAAVETYRRFHAAEATFQPETSHPYLLQSTVAPVAAAMSGPATPRPATPRPAGPPGRAGPGHSRPAPSRSPAPWTSQTLPGSQRPAPARRPPATVISLLAVAVLALFGVVLGGYVLSHGRQAGRPQCTASAGTTAGLAAGHCGRAKPQSTRTPRKPHPAKSGAGRHQNGPRLQSPRRPAPAAEPLRPGDQNNYLDHVLSERSGATAAHSAHDGAIARTVAPSRFPPGP